jgi:hypothetical protein
MIHLKRDKYGKWERKTNKAAVTLGIIAIGILGAYGYREVYAGSSIFYASRNNVSITSGERVQDIDATSGCLRSGEGTYDCTSYQEIGPLLKDGVTWYDARSPLQVLNDVCTSKGITSDDCSKTLYGMAVIESRMGKEMTGDNGNSHGWFHIMGYNKVSSKCMNDLECSASWSLDRMIRLGYKTDPDYAVRRHNGSASNPMTLAYLNKVKAAMPK